jgi:hypothetical protein
LSLVPVLLLVVVPRRHSRVTAVRYCALAITMLCANKFSPTAASADDDDSDDDEDNEDDDDDGDDDEDVDDDDDDGSGCSSGIENRW